MKNHVIKEYITELAGRGMLEKCVSVNAEAENAEVKGLTYDSREAGPGTLFICKGAAFKEEYLESAAEKGAICYLSQEEYEGAAIPGIIVGDIREAMPVAAAMFYSRPWEDLTVFGIGGTKGKSTSAYYMKSVIDDYLEEKGEKESAIVSSIDVYDGVESFESHITTPEAVELQRHMRNALNSGMKYLEMEVSSQALKYNRLDEIRLDVGIFMNVSEDHISPIEHSSFEDYLTSKLKMFAITDTAVVNLGSDCIDRVLEAAGASERLVTFAVGEDREADFTAYNIRKNGMGIDFTVKSSGKVGEAFNEEFSLGMPGFFNVENALGVIAGAVSAGIPLKNIRSGLLKARSKGRMETTLSRDGKILAILDYAHNKLSFEKLYGSMKEEYPGYRIVGLFGCPGGKAFNRREELGRIAGRNSAKVYLAAEDPGKEKPGDISEQIAVYLREEGCPYEIIDDRGEAIAAAMKEAERIASETGEKTLLLITGKGHETRQKVGTEYLPCISDADYIEKYIKEYDERVNS